MNSPSTNSASMNPIPWTRVSIHELILFFAKSTIVLAFVSLCAGSHRFSAVHGDFRAGGDAMSRAKILNFSDPEPPTSRNNGETWGIPAPIPHELVNPLPVTREEFGQFERWWRRASGLLRRCRPMVAVPT